MNRLFFTSKNKTQFSIPRTVHAEMSNNRAAFSIPETISCQVPQANNFNIKTPALALAGVFVFLVAGLFTASGLAVADHQGTYEVTGGRDANNPYRWVYEVEADGNPQNDISHLNVQLDCFTDNLSSVVIDIEKTQGNKDGQVTNGDPSTGTTGDLIKWDELNGKSATLAFTLNDIYPEVANGALVILKSGAHTGNLFLTANGPDCTPVPDPDPATLTLVKTVDNSAGGTATTSDFQAYVNGNPVDWSTTLTLDAGTYTASEDTLTNYSASSWGGDCATDGTVTLAEGQNATCTVTNTYVPVPVPDPATLIVIKNVDNTGGGTLSPEDFIMEVTGTNVSTSTFPGSSTGTTVTLDAGSYSVDEQDSFEYDKTIGSDCSGTISEGETRTCVVTNTYVPTPDPDPATLTLVKTVDNSAGGTATTSDFQAYVNGDPVDWSTTLTLDAGTYIASEDTLTNYSASSWGGDCATDGTVTLAEGQNATCTVTNTYVPTPDPDTYSISGAKWRDQNNNQVWDTNEAGLQGWTINLTGTATGTVVTNGDGEYVFSGLEPGNYTVCEVQQSGWAQTYPTTNNGCHEIEITNSDVADVNFGNRTVTTTSGGNPVLSIVKDVEPSITNPGGTVTYTVTVTNTGNRTAVNVILTDTLPDGLAHEDTGLTVHSWNLGNLTPGQSTTTTFNALISEDAEVGFYVNTAEAVANNHGPVSDDAEVEVRGVVLGDEAEPVLEIEKVGDRTLVNPGSQMTYTITITNTGEAPAVNLVVTDTLPEGFTLAEDGSEVIQWNIPLLEVGESWTVSFLVNISEDITEGEHLNVVEANAENYDGELFASYLVESREGEVLGETGISLAMMLIWLMALFIAGLSMFKISASTRTEALITR
jgi:uncharacterized repeat protein (TIGR01451 family)